MKPFPGQADIGDTSGSDIGYASYAVNTLNQYTSRSATGAVDVIGLSYATNAVSINSQPAYRKGEYFRGEVGVNNASAAVWQAVSISTNGTTARSD